ncbi:GNAT family N-acetyltransferase [Neisseriaceae bacterium TC5R-5]|nr:GNAT family N-acetyltransferase [Neisseriaceae bacterium TC5R-5]
MKTILSLKLDSMVLKQVVDGVRECELMRFRHRVFREELGWLPVDEFGLDYDNYDSYSDNYVVLSEGRVVGCVRFTLGDKPFMLEKEFSSLLFYGESLIKSRHTAEVTRFAVSSSLDPQQAKKVARLLYLSLWEWSLINEISQLYFVVKPAFYRRLLAMGFPITPVGMPRPLDGGVMSQAGYFDWRQATHLLVNSLRKEISLSEQLINKINMLFMV